DHVGNAAYLRTKYGAPIAIHPADVGMVERGDMSWNRNVKPDYIPPLFQLIMWLVPLLGSSNQFEIFSPDVTLDEDADLADYGFAATVLCLPGHSKGSIGLLTTDGVLFCGDLLSHLFGKPRCLLIDNRTEWSASIAKIKGLAIRTVYPGHGKPFPIAQAPSGR
ncbi:MAG: MBL fold metallo-hydrolase, partial [Caldilineaceae bacterium]|nr:MBL fold metallo-hydrolase [Caldilineaceae bacterium]